MNTIDKLAKAIRDKGKVVTPRSLSLESLFHNYGTLTEAQAAELMNQKRERLSRIAEKYESSVGGQSFIPGLAYGVMFNKWCGITK